MYNLMILERVIKDIENEMRVVGVESAEVFRRFNKYNFPSQYSFPNQFYNDHIKNIKNNAVAISKNIDHVLGNLPENIGNRKKQDLVDYKKACDFYSHIDEKVNNVNITIH